MSLPARFQDTMNSNINSMLDRAPDLEKVIRPMIHKDD
jgi:phage shock protein A